LIANDSSAEVANTFVNSTIRSWNERPFRLKPSLSNENAFSAGKVGIRPNVRSAAFVFLLASNQFSLKFYQSVMTSGNMSRLFVSAAR
jgi:hypothetical protein